MFATVTNLAERQREMVARAGAGDQETFRRLYTEYSPYAYGVLRRLMGDSPYVEDVLQQVFVKVYRELPEFKGDRPFRSWLSRACCLTVYNHLRKERRHVSVPFEEARTASAEESGAPPVMGSRESGPEQAYIEAEIHRRTHIILNKLTPAKRMAIIMCDFEGYSLKEAAELLQMAKFTLRTRLVRARKEFATRAEKDEQLIQLIEAGEKK